MRKYKILFIVFLILDIIGASFAFEINRFCLPFLLDMFAATNEFQVALAVFIVPLTIVFMVVPIVVTIILIVLTILFYKKIKTGGSKDGFKPTNTE